MFVLYNYLLLYFVDTSASICSPLIPAITFRTARDAMARRVWCVADPICGNRTHLQGVLSTAILDDYSVRNALRLLHQRVVLRDIWLSLDNIKTGTPYPTLLKSLDESVGVDDGAAAGVDEDGGLLHAPESYVSTQSTFKSERFELLKPDARGSRNQSHLRNSSFTMWYVLGPPGARAKTTSESAAISACDARLTSFTPNVSAHLASCAASAFASGRVAYRTRVTPKGTRRRRVA